ncbi:MAG: gfo/Idh/MocA family oxidoreductase, partial [Verrucomicrobiae bacterium]|nr:gfo/Idh/MocA family oxidoreductase [Verrucomicrobiae bacterium]
MTRRKFIASLAAATPQIIPAAARGAHGTVAPSNRVTLGLIGLGTMGAGHLAMALGT